MCGIVGFVGRGDEAVLVRMADAIKYRGPDDEGYFFDNLNHVGLGFRRLSIIDLATGNQPIFNEDRTVAIVFNGEIYNFSVLRALLEKHHVFRTHTDTEVIVHLYEDVGEKVFEQLDGMFAIAIWDSKKKKIVLGRDKFGEKPLFWYYRDGLFAFASESKALFKHPDISPSLNHVSMLKYLVYEYVPGEESMFQDIHKLAPGNYLVYEKNEVKVSSYYDIAQHVSLNQVGDFQHVSVELEGHLNRIVSSRMVADVPLGVFLSGGLDSSTIAYYAQKNSARPVETFSIGFEEDSYDESRWARKVAERLGTKHHERIFSKKEFLDSALTILRKLDEPLADASLLPTHLLSIFAKEHVTVALGGDGGDELWYGYQTFQAQKIWKMYQRVPSFIRHSIETLVKALPVSHAYFSFDFKAKKFLEGAYEWNNLKRNQLWLAAFQPNEIRELLSTEQKRLFDMKDVLVDIDSLNMRSRKFNDYQALSYAYLKHYLADDILMKVDRASMYASLEVRAPFLDNVFAEFVFSLPPRMKMRRLQGKYLLKKHMETRLGKDIVWRKKQGFSIPIAQWLRYDGHDFLEIYFNHKRILAGGLWDPAYVQKLIDEHVSGKSDHRKKLWTLLVFEVWRENYGI
jgi:asparagine synthase (glutamine-hydrolysing)